MKAVLHAIILLTSISVGSMAQASEKSAPGLEDGKLSKCPDSPNCICTEYRSDTEHYRAPVGMQIGPDTGALVIQAAKAIGGKLTVERDDYLAFTFTSRIFRFVDDFEVRLDKEAGLLHIRSASRIGYSDFGVNRRRVERFKEALAEHGGKPGP